MAARKSLGAASDFYRLRLLHVDDADLPDLDWRDDILWRRPPTQSIDEFELWRVEAVAVADEEDITVIGVFDSQADGHEALAGAEEDLAELTRSEFEERYFPAED
jgi:hypothetical protein